MSGVSRTTLRSRSRTPWRFAYRRKTRRQAHAAPSPALPRPWAPRSVTNAVRNSGVTRLAALPHEARPLLHERVNVARQLVPRIGAALLREVAEVHQRRNTREDDTCGVPILVEPHHVLFRWLALSKTREYGRGS